MIEIGKLTSSVGLKGEMKVTIYSGDLRNFKQGMEVIVNIAGNTETHFIEKISNRNGTIIVKLKQLNNRDDSDKYRGAIISIDEDELEDLPEGEYYIKDLIGLNVIDADNKESIGKVKDVLDNGQIVYQVENNDGKEFLIPGVKEFVREIDIKNGIIEVKLIPGLIE